MPTPDRIADDTHRFDPETRKILALLASVVFVAVVNGTMINVALPHIGADFGATEGVYGWLVSGYSLAFGVFNVIDGRLADIWGKKRLYLLGVLALGVCSLLVAASPTLPLAIGVRVVQGAGAAAVPVLGMTIIKTVVPAERRGKAIGVILSSVGVAASIGPFLGGLLVQFVHWRVVFLLPGLVVLAVPFAWRLLPDSLNERKEEPFDFVGAVLMGAGISLLVYGFSAVHDGEVGAELGPILGGGVVSLGAFGLWIRHKTDPFVPPALFANLDYLTVCAIGFISNAGRFGTIVLVPIFLTQLNGLEPLQVGAVLFPGALAIALLSPRAGAIADRNGPRWSVFGGVAAMAAGGLVTSAFAGGSALGVTVGMTLYGIGFAFAQTPLVNTATALVPQAHEGSGIGLFMMIFFVGGGAGVAMAVTATELQGREAAGLFGLGADGGGPYANAMLLLTGLTLLGLILAWRLPLSAVRHGPDRR